MAQEATSPAKARHYGPSFQQLLLLAFLLIAGLLAPVRCARCSRWKR